MWRNVASNFLTIAIVLLVVAAGIVGWAQQQYTGPGPLAEGVCFKVARGSNMRVVATDLADSGAITSGYIFRVGADYEKKSGDLKAGSFLIAPKTSMQGIVDVITRGGQSTCGTEVNYRIGVNGSDIILRELDPATNQYQEVIKFDPEAETVPDGYSDRANSSDVRFRVTLAEGVTSWQVVEALKRADFLDGEIKEVPAEGHLSPDSYEVVRGTARADVLSEMGRRQEEILADLWDKRASDLPYASPEEALVMASIVEKETGVPEERPLVASVFVNRLEQGMKLQTDPTVIYGLTKGQGVLGRGLRQSELRRKTPYNTYVIDGLPPTPIANPGAKSIEAALNPEASNYLFFVADGTGGHAFAETLAEHNDNVAKWRAIEAEKASGN